MRTFSIILSTIVVVLLVGATGYWLGTGGLSRHNAVFAAVNENGDLEITARAQQIQVQSVTFNDATGNSLCGARRIFLKHVWRAVGDWNGTGVVRWYETTPVHPTSPMLQEGDIVIMPFYRGACGDTIVKAEVVTTFGTYVFRYPRDAKAANGQPLRTPLVADHWPYLN